MTDTPEGDRIAKVLSRAGIASRRGAERMIELGQVTVNGKVITSPALNVTPKDRITVAGQPVLEPDVARLWLYYKPDGLVTSTSDEKGRETVFDHLPPDLPRVMSVGRLDLNSEGLLLLTNDGELKRRLELPSTGWLRKYRVRVKGTPVDPDLEPLRKGITVEGQRFQPMIVSLDRVQGANAWLTVGLREGKNREIRRAMTAIGLTVNRLIRVSYGPFRLGDMAPGDVEEVRGKTLRDQLGLPPASEDMTGTARSKLARARPGAAATKPARAASGTPVTKSGRADAPSGRPAAKPARTAAPRPDAARSALAGTETATTLRAKPKATRPAPSRNSGPAGSPPKNPPQRGK
jgi:23S rRNA pseudouridine2605 synthase